jgi:diguanylate cyclase
MNAENSNSNADVARRVLRLMTAHSSDYRPRTYFLWHEYVVGKNADLCERMDKVVAAHGKLSAAGVDELYLKLVDTQSEDLLSRLHGDMHRLIEGLVASTKSASGHTTHLGNELVQFEVAVGASRTPEDILRVISRLSTAAQASRAELERVRLQLENSEVQVNRMSEELRVIREEVHVDPLSGLFNRRRFASGLAELAETAVANNSPLTLLMLDIDRFKMINDKHGHPFGDQVIVGVGQAIKASVKGRDLPARFGGDEFSLILPDTALREGIVVADYIRRIVRQAQIVDFATNETVTNLTLSVGIATLVPGESAEQLVRRADKALYRAKQKGRDCVVAAEQ